MAQSHDGILKLADALPNDPAAAEATRRRAAEIVEDYVQEFALPALDGAVAATCPGDAGEHAVAARRASELLDAEVTRFRALDPHR